MNRSGGCIRVDESAFPVNEPFRPAVLIPVYNHETAIGPTLDEVLARVDAITAGDVAAVCRDFYGVDMQTVARLGPG